MLYSLRQKLLLWQTQFWNKLLFFPSIKIKQLEKRIKELEAQEIELYEEHAAKIIQRYKRSVKFQAVIKKEYITWKAAIRQKLIEQNNGCEKCGCQDRKLTIDHIIPQRFLKDLGISPEKDRNEKNFRLLCDLCNARKGHEFDFTDPRTRYLILEYLATLPPQANPFKKKTQLDNLRGTPYDPELIQNSRKKK